MTTLQLVGLCLFVVLLGFIVRNIHWPEFVASKQKQHMLFGWLLFIKTRMYW